MSGCLEAELGLLGSEDSCTAGEHAEWCFDSSGEFDAVVSGSVLFRERSFGPSRGDADEVVALDADTGVTQWSYGSAGGQDSFGSITVDDGLYFSYCTDQGCRRLIALSTDGDERWTEDVNAGHQAPTVDDGTVFVGGELTVVRAFDSTSGAKRWEIEPEGTGPATVVDATDAVFVATDEALTVLDRDDGDTLWGYAPGDEPREFIQDVLVEEGLAYVVTDRRVAVIEDGERRWQYSFESEQRFAGIHGLASGRLVVSTETEDRLFRLRAFGIRSGEPAWPSDRIAVPPGSYDTPVGIHDNVAYVGGPTLRAIDVSTGRQRWSVSFDAGPINVLQTVEDAVSRRSAVLAWVGESSLATVTPGGETEWQVSLGESIDSFLGAEHVYVATEEAAYALSTPGGQS